MSVHVQEQPETLLKSMNSGQESVRHNLNKKLSRKILKAFERDPGASFEQVLLQSLDDYKIRLSRAQEKERKKASLDDGTGIHVPKPFGQMREGTGHFIPPDTIPEIIFPLASTLVSLLREQLPDSSSNFNDENLSVLLQHRLPELINKGESIFLDSTGIKKVVQLNSNIVVRIGHGAAHDESSILSYVRRHTSIPVPQPLGFVTTTTTSYLFMSLIKGQTLEKRWPTMSPAHRTLISEQLNAMLSELRQLPRPSHAPLGSLSPPHVCKNIITKVHTSQPNLMTISEFHDFLTSNLFSNVPKVYKRWLRSQLRDNANYRIMLTHGDFHPRNIMVEDVKAADSDDISPQVSGLIDWEAGGWYPEYWEMYKALNTRVADDESAWWDALPQAILGYDREVVERRLVEGSMPTTL